MLKHVAQELRENPGVCLMAAVGATKGIFETYVAPQRPSVEAFLKSERFSLVAAFVGGVLCAQVWSKLGGWKYDY